MNLLVGQPEVIMTRKDCVDFIYVIEIGRMAYY